MSDTALSRGRSLDAWADLGVCASSDVDASLFFPDGKGGAAQDDIDAAKAICATCPVRPQCREHGIRFEKFGVWGGLSESERRRIRSIRRRERAR